MSSPNCTDSGLPAPVQILDKDTERYPGQAYFWEHSTVIRQAEQNWYDKHKNKP